MHTAACTNVQIVDICWVLSALHSLPCWGINRTPPPPPPPPTTTTSRYFLGEAGNKAPSQTQVDPKRYTLRRGRSYKELGRLVRPAPCEDCVLRPASSALLSIQGATPHPFSNLRFCLRYSNFVSTTYN